MTCPACTEAGRRELHRGYMTGCPGCESRKLSRAPWIKAERYLRTLPEADREPMRDAAIAEWLRVKPVKVAA